MGICESTKKEKQRTYESSIIDKKESKKGILLLIKMDINSMMYYIFYINNIYIPLCIANKNNLTSGNDKIILYDKERKIYINNLWNEIKYEKYEYFFMMFREFQDIPFIICQLNEQEDEINTGENINLLDSNLQSVYSSKIKSINNNDYTFEYESTDKKVINSYGNIIKNSKGNIIGVNIEDKYGVLLKPLFKIFFNQNNQKNFNGLKTLNGNNLIENMLNNKSINNKTKYIIPLFLAFAKIEKLKIISDASFKQIKIEENNVINLIRKFMIFYLKNDYLNAKNVIKEFENLYNDENTNFKKLVDFISKESKQQFHNNKSSKASINQNEIQKLIFMIYEKEETCFNCNVFNKQYICNSMYLYTQNNQCKNLQSLISEWENAEKETCPKCSIKYSSTIKIIYWPEILIVIMNDNNEIKDIDDLEIQKYKQEYKLICFIEHSENNNFNVFYKEQNKWYMIKTDDDDNFTSKEVENEIKSLIKYPNVLFYEKSNASNVNSHNLENDKKRNNRIINITKINSQKKNIPFDSFYKHPNSNTFNNSGYSNNLYYPQKKNNNKLNSINLNNLSNPTITPRSFINLNNNKNYNNPYSTNVTYLNFPVTNAPIYKNISYNNPNSNIYGHINVNTPNTFLIQNNKNSNKISINSGNRIIHISKTPEKLKNNNNIQNLINYGHLNKSILKKPLYKNKYNNKTNEIINGHSNNPKLNTPLNGNINYNKKEINPEILINPTNTSLQSITPINNISKNNQMITNNQNYTKAIKEAYIEPINNKNIPFNQYIFNKGNEKPNIKSDVSKINNNNIINNVNEEEITLFFIFNKNGKELYLDVKKSIRFSKVIEKLEDKYLWLKDNIKIKQYLFNGKEISKGQINNGIIVKDIGLEDESKIYIIENN